MCKTSKVTLLSNSTSKSPDCSNLLNVGYMSNSKQRGHNRVRTVHSSTLAKHTGKLKSSFGENYLTYENADSNTITSGQHTQESNADTSQSEGHLRGHFTVIAIHDWYMQRPCWERWVTLEIMGITTANVKKLSKVDQIGIQEIKIYIMQEFLQRLCWEVCYMKIK